MTQISVFLASWVITHIHRVGTRSVLDLALLCMAKTLTVQGHGAPRVPGSPCCARTDARRDLLRLGLIHLRVGTQSRDARSGLPRAPSETAQPERSEDHNFCLITMRMLG